MDDPWEYDGRHYLITAFSDGTARRGFGWELEDVAPTPGRGVILEAFQHATTGALTFTAFSDEPLPLALVVRFVTEAPKAFPPPD
jgi:hypothetical protein